MTHKSFIGRRLYPRQRTLYKLIFLETENFDDYDREVIEEWRQGFIQRRDTFGVQPDIMERVAYLKKYGYRRFPHIQLVLGRRGSKGIIGGGLGCEQMAYFYSLDDWQAHYDIDAGQNMVVSVVATSQGQAQRYQFADIRRTVLRCKYLAPHVATSKDYFLSIRTPADLRRIAEYKASKTRIDHEIATVTAMALSASSAAGRGGVGSANFFDEMAHMVMGTGSVKSGDEIYNAYKPSLDQFGKDKLTVANSSPFCLAPDTRVLTEDMRWVPVETVTVGDHLIGFDEHVEPGRGHFRKWRQATVTETSVIHAPRYAITLESGKRVVCTSEHLWLSKRWSQHVGRGKNRNGGPQVHRFEWRKAIELKPGDEIKSLGTDPWEEDTSRDAGWLAGFFDGEGHYSGGVLGVGQNEGPVLEKVRRLLKEREFTVVEDVSEDSRRTAEHFKLRINGGLPEVMRFLGTVRPERLVPTFVSRLYGGRSYSRAGRCVERVVSVERVEDGPVVALGTSTNTLLAEGMFSHNTKIGIFYKLYQDGCVPMKNYRGEWYMATEKSLGIDAEEQIQKQTADPEMLILQLPSWGLYEDWEKGPKLIGVKFKRPITFSPVGDEPENMSMAREEEHNPEKFRVERRGQFAEVEGAYLNPIAVERMFRPPGWRPALEAQTRGYLAHQYRIHCDPSRVDANFGLAIGHNEIAPCDNCGAMPLQGLTFHQCQQPGCGVGMHWPHVIFDYLHVWKPGNFEPDEDGRRKVDPLFVMREIEDILVRFPSTTKITFDQYDSAIPLALLRQKFSPRIKVAEITATVQENQRRMERFKSVLNLGWMHGYNDGLYENGDGSLLEMEMKFLAERNGKVVKQAFGPVTTKDLFDAASTVATDLLSDALERYKGQSLTHPSFGSSDSLGLKTGREFQRMGSAGMAVAQRLGGAAQTNPAREKLGSLHSNHPRRGYEPTRAQSIRARGMPRAGKRGRQ